MDSILELRALVREGVQYSDGTFKSERHFLDFIVDGQSLWEALGKRHDMVSVLCAEYIKDATANILNHLLLSGKADFTNDRRSLFVCSECAGLDCGAITAVIERQGETFTWRAFGYENNYEDKLSLDAYNTVGPFTFDATKYEITLMHAAKLLSGAGK